jgi:hypothetical protein
MKKIIFISMMFGMFPLAVEASNGDAADTTKTSGKSSDANANHQFEGWFAGFGVHIATVGERVDFTYPIVNGVKLYDSSVAEANNTATRLGGSFVVGVGKGVKNSNIYISFEVGCNFGPATGRLEADKRSMITPAGGLNVDNAPVLIRNYSVETKTNGVVPFAAIRGGHVNSHGLLSFVKFGVAYLNSEEHSFGYKDDVAGNAFTYFDSREKVSGVVPIVGVGMEKSFAERATIRAEYEYTFGKSKTRAWDSGDSVKVTAKDSSAIRVLIIYHGRLGQLWREVSPI